MTQMQRFFVFPGMKFLIPTSTKSSDTLCYALKKNLKKQINEMLLQNLLFQEKKNKSRYTVMFSNVSAIDFNVDVPIFL